MLISPVEFLLPSDSRINNYRLYLFGTNGSSETGFRPPKQYLRLPEFLARLEAVLGTENIVLPPNYNPTHVDRFSSHHIVRLFLLFYRAGNENQLLRDLGDTQLRETLSLLEQEAFEIYRRILMDMFGMTDEDVRSAVNRLKFALEHGQLVKAAQARVEEAKNTLTRLQAVQNGLMEGNIFSSSPAEQAQES